MFDSIECNYPLPLSKEVIELENFDVYEADHQTKSLNNLLELYIITEDGELFCRKDEHEWIDDDDAFLKGYMQVTSSELVKQNFHGIIEFGCYEQLREEADSKVQETSVSLDYEAKFIDGKLVSIDLVNQSIDDTTKHYEEMQVLFLKQKERARKWYNKHIFYTKWFRAVKRQCIYKPLNGLHKFTGKLLTLSYRI